MENSTLVFLLVAFALLLGAAGGFLWGRRGHDADLAADHDQLESTLADLGSARESLADARARVELLETQNRALTSLDEQENAVLHALSPVAEKLSGVQQQIAILERDRHNQYGQLSTQLLNSQRAEAALLESTRSLSSALSNNSTRGRWGEVQLRRIVESAGLLNRVDFHEQMSLATQNGTVRPDMVVQLPGQKFLVLDSKVPLSTFLKAQEVEGQERLELMKGHAKAVRAHIDTLASKRYWDAVPASPDMVVCFLPAESFLAAAVEADAALLDYGFSRNVILASPSSLLALLKAVALTWKQELLTENAKELFDLSQELYVRLGTLGGHASKMGASLKSSVENYNKFIGALESRVLTTSRKMAALNLVDEEPLLAPVPVDATPRVLTAPELLEDSEPLENSA